jgi:hypothetical protein
MHFCFWDHLHLSTGLKAISALQWSPCVSLKLRFSPLLLPPSLPPLLLLYCTPPPVPGLSAALRLCAPLRPAPRVVLLFLPPPRSAHAGRPLLLHVGQKPLAAATPHCQARRRRPSLCVRLHDLSLPSSFFLRPCGAIKVNQALFSPAVLPLLPPPTPNRRRRFPTGILLSRTIPTLFLEPRASSPPPLAAQLDLVQPRPFPSPDLPHPEPPLIGAARARPCRRQHAPPPLRPIQVWKSLLPCPLVLVHALVPHVRRPFTRNGGVPPRPPHLPIDARFPCCPPCAFTLTTSPRLHRPCATGSSPPATTRRRLIGRAMSRRAGTYP